jgi:hypothetical protein
MLLMASQHTQIPGTYAEIKRALEINSTQPKNAALMELAQVSYFYCVIKNKTWSGQVLSPSSPQL